MDKPSAQSARGEYGHNRYLLARDIIEALESEVEKWRSLAQGHHAAISLYLKSDGACNEAKEDADTCNASGCLYCSLIRSWNEYERRINDRMNKSPIESARYELGIKIVTECSVLVMKIVDCERSVLALKHGEKNGGASKALITDAWRNTNIMRAAADDLQAVIEDVLAMHDAREEKGE